MADTQHFCLRWNNYQSSITSAFENLRDDEDFVDVTLACDGKSLKAHRVVLSACSPYFRELLKSTPCKHPVIVLQDVAFADLHALVEFIYHGEVNVHQRNLSSFLKTAEVLRVSGLTQQAEDRDEFPAQLQSSRNHQQGFTDKLVEDALFTSPPSPPPPSQHSNATSGGATVNQLLRRAAAAAAIASSSTRRERHNSAEQQSDSSEQSQHSAPSKRARTSTNVENSNHNNGETTSASTNQVSATDFSSSFSSKQNQGSTTATNNRKADSDGNAASGDGDSSPSPTSGMLDGVKSEPLELLCGAADMDNSNDSIEATGDIPPGGLQQSSLSAGDHDDHDSIQGHPGSAYLSAPESKLFTSATSSGSFNFSMAALAADPTGLSEQDRYIAPHGSAANYMPTVIEYNTSKIVPTLTVSGDKAQNFEVTSGIGSQSLQGNPDGSAGTSSQELLGRGWVSGGSGGVSGPPYCPLCRKSFTRAWSLQRHMADTHFYVPQSFECDVCGRSYRSRNSLVSHKSQYHGGSSGSRASKEPISSCDSDNILIKGEKHDRGEGD